MSRGFLVVLAGLALAFAVLTGLAVERGILRPQQQTAAIGGPFHLTSTSGRSVDQSVLKGKWSAVFFGYSFCPDACPTTLFALGQAEKALGPKAADFQTVFISVDPARDTPKVLGAYLHTPAFPQHVVGLTGSPAQVAEAAHAYKVFYQAAGAGPDYTVNHSSFTYLMNPKGRFACVIPYDTPPQAIAARVEKAMSQGAAATSC
ncbi:MAG TPA: SCO family protein [Phenylobacterium sp.]|uniref:SCO family protein n=1 Tax=Phenylobacterium sp. TaxID=1871053 RepID=UPI002C035D91|nr:SCO family protein [Phenylobacterium sp.]HSV03765.1 SCO family protein [Phenylobacterium sp.]